MTRAPKVGDYVVLGSLRYGTGKYTGIIASVVSVRDKSFTVDARNDDRAIVIRASSYQKDDPWSYVAFVAPEEAARWRAARAKASAWRKAIPAGAQWTGGYYTTVADRHVVVADRDRVDTAEQAEKSAAIYTAVAAWLRAKPPADDLLITVEAS